ncbi:MAG: prepilin-type N-terminal cleavage/methylation domain-containing protein [Tepidisphaeraceae bacterium]|jgi:prepilin-type processing-associated H-X9-DG protein/prepilin-type N-terminal cleavage/methylation domain-containing protein
MKHKAFTLVEVLVVIGIIALLISILLPAVNRAFEHVNRVACASNFRQVGAGITMYLNDNKGSLPVPPGVTADPNDAFWWQPARIADIGRYTMGPYLRLTPTSLKMLRCPTDEQAATREAAGKYPFTYVFNDNMNGNGLNSVQKIGQIKNPSEKVFLYEENGPTINDGRGQLWNVHGAWGNISMLGLRHDRGNRKQYPDASSAATGITNPNGQANVLFADGHVDYVTRTYAHSKSHALPDPDAFFNEPEIGP